VLDVAALSRAKLTVFFGEFMRGLDQVANRFFDRVEELGFATTPKA